MVNTVSMSVVEHVGIFATYPVLPDWAQVSAASDVAVHWQLAVFASAVGATPVLVTIHFGIVLPDVQAALLAAPHLHCPSEVSHLLTVPSVTTLGRQESALQEHTADVPSAAVAAVVKAALFVQTGFPDAVVHLPAVDPHSHCPDTHRLAVVTAVQSESEPHSRHWQIPRADTATLSEAHVTPVHGSGFAVVVSLGFAVEGSTSSSIMSLISSR